MRSAMEKSEAVRVWFPERPASMLGQEWAKRWVRPKVAADLPLVVFR
jgi:hypothetical protein